MLLRWRYSLSRKNNPSSSVFRRRKDSSSYFVVDMGKGPSPPEADRKARAAAALSVKSAVTASFFLVLMFTISLVYSQGIDRFSSFAATTFQITLSLITKTPPYPHIPEHPITCNATAIKMQATCPSNYPHQPTNKTATTLPQRTCPEYFRWIHEDLKPWKARGITREMLEEIESHKEFRHFRLTIVNGTAYVKMYEKAYQTRDTLTLWGVLQLLKLYPGRLPDIDLIFQCHDKPSIRKDRYKEEEAPPLFHFCGSDDTYDVVFPDWSFWGWPEINIKPWKSLKKELTEGNRIEWIKREPYAFWRGSLFTGKRKSLAKCNSTDHWGALLYEQDWRKEVREGFKNSDMSKQCKHRYKIYMEGNAWSVSEKYILACDSMALVINPFYYDFFTRDLVPLKHYWPIDPNNICHSIKAAVDWGNKYPSKAQEIGRRGSSYIQDEITMQNVYDYMFHVLSEYGKLLRYKPTVPPGAIELCSEPWVCARNDLEKAYKLETMEAGALDEEPCPLPPPFEESEVGALMEEATKGFLQVRSWEVNGTSSIQGQE